jgi:UDPglucose 6-dehydrogenase
MDGLLEGGARVRAYDPAVIKALAKSPRDGVSYCQDEYEAAEGADALVLATEWNQFRGLDLDRLKELLKSPVLLDLRNVYEPDTLRSKGFKYASVGR